LLVSGTAGTGKSSLAAHFAAASCQRRERCLYFAFEESVNQIVRNMRSIGIDLAPWMKKGLLKLEAARPTLGGIEMHLAVMYKLVREFEPALVIVDPITNLAEAGTTREATAMLTRLMDFLKSRGITSLFTSLTPGASSREATDVGVSSLTDTWLLLRDIEPGGERNRAIHVLKSRGMAHSNQIREFLLTNRGIELREVYNGPEGVLTGSMRVAQEAREAASERQRTFEFASKRRALERRKREIESKLIALRAELEEEEAAIEAATGLESNRLEYASSERTAMSKSRQVGPAERTRRGNGKQGARP